MDNKSTASWLNAEFLESILRRKFVDEDVSVTNFDVSKAVPKGGGYMSDLNRVIVYFRKIDKGDVKSGEFSFIIKTQPVNVSQLTFSLWSNAFIKELSMYQVTLPAMYQLLKRKKPDMTVKSFAPGVFHCSRPDTIVLEDLKELGFVLADRRHRLNLAHSSLVLRSLAHFHALSIALYLEDPTSMETYAEGHYIECNRSSVETFTKLMFSALISEIEKTQGYERFADKLRKVAETATDCMMESVRSRQGTVRVLNHGDVWVNNLLFKYCPISGKVVDVRFIDFQLSRFTSPAIELNFFFFLSLREEVFFQNLDQLIAEYHRELSERLKDLGCDVNLISLSELKQQLKDTEKFALITACTKLWFVLINPAYVDDLEFPSDSQVTPIIAKIFADPLMKQAYKKLLPYFETRGVL